MHSAFLINQATIFTELSTKMRDDAEFGRCYRRICNRALGSLLTYIFFKQTLSQDSRCSFKCTVILAYHVRFLIWNFPVLIQTLVVFGSHKGMVPMETLLRSSLEGFDPPTVLNLDASAAILYSSGTSGRPKPTMLSQRNIIAQLVISSWVFFNITRGPKDAASEYSEEKTMSGRASI